MFNSLSPLTKVSGVILLLGVVSALGLGLVTIFRESPLVGVLTLVFLVAVVLFCLGVARS